MVGTLRVPAAASLASFIPVMRAKAGLPRQGPRILVLEEIRPGMCDVVRANTTLHDAQLEHGDLLIFVEEQQRLSERVHLAYRSSHEQHVIAASAKSFPWLLMLLLALSTATSLASMRTMPSEKLCFAYRQLCQNDVACLKTIWTKYGWIHAGPCRTQTP